MSDGQCRSFDGVECRHLQCQTASTLELLDPGNEDTVFIDTLVTSKAPQRTTPSA